MALALLGSGFARAQSTTVDAEWDRKFREFTKRMNDFIRSLNAGIFDAKQWNRAREAWNTLEGNNSCAQKSLHPNNAK